MGVVYLAKHIETGKRFALKTILVRNLTHVSSIRREIRALSRLRHPGIVRIVDEGIEGNVPWYAMAFLEGVTLRTYCAEFLWGGSEISTANASDISDKSKSSHQEIGKVSTRWWTHIFGTTMDVEEIPDWDDQLKSKMDHPVQTDQGHRVKAAGGSLSSVLTLMNRLCLTLSYLHGEEMVHGDLKPDNIMVRRDGMPVIMDFGLVTHLWGDESREQLAVDGISGGTVMYIAPEKILGELVDARADLYSLGCIMYEMVTGRTPFPGRTPGQVIKAQLECKPIPPSVLVEGVPDELDRIILLLLTKKPKDRISHSDDVSRVLMKLGAQSDEWENSPRPRAYLYRPRFAGRGKEIRIIETQIELLESGNGSLVLIGGESGIGKTRFLLRLIREARRRKIKILSGECFQVGTHQTSGGKEVNIPLQALKQPIRKIAEYCMSMGQAETDRIFDSRGKVLRMYEPYLSELPGQDKYPAPITLPADAARFRLFTCLSETFHALTAEQPYLLVLDDLQWADDLTMGVLEFILRTGYLNQTRLLITGTYRTEESNPELKRILNSPKSICLELGRLDEDGVSSIVTDMLGMQEGPPVFVPFLTRFSEGNPFFVSEYLRTALETGVLYRDTNGYWQIAEENDDMATDADLESLPLPKALAGLLESRLSKLSIFAVEVVSAASVIGREIPVLLLWSMIPFSDETLDAIDELIKKQVLSEEKAGELCFVHDKIREIVHERIPREQHSILHLSAAQAIEAMYGEENDEHFSTLARHWEQAGDRIRAQKYYLSSARQEVSRFALQEAETAYQAWLNLLDQPTYENIQIRNEYAKNVLSIQGRFKEAQNEYMISLEDARNLDEKLVEGQCLLGLARTNEILGNVKQASELCRNSLAIFSNAGNLENEAEALSCLGSICFNRGSLEEAKTLYHQSIDIYGSLDSQPLKGSNLEHLALVYWNQGDMKKAQILFEQALKIFRNSNNKHALGRCLGNFANIYSHQGDYQKALDLNEQSLAISKEIGDKHTEGIFSRQSWYPLFLSRGL